jgi:predicted DNA-binding ribbon-helix-helix protein
MTLLKTGRPTTRKEKAIYEIQDFDKDKARLNVNLDKKFYKHIKKVALEKDLTISEFVILALQAYSSKP